MAYPEILRDKRKAAIPQLWDGSNWRPLKGTKDGHQQTQLVGPDGQPVGSENPLEVRVRELEEKLDAMNQLLQSGDAKMQLSGQRALLRMDIYDTPIDVSPNGGSTTVTVQPPAGEIWSVRDLLIRIPAVSGATSGSHVLVFRYGGTSSQYNRMFITSPYDTAIEVQGVSVLHGSVDEPLTDRRDQMQYIRGLELSQSVPLVLLYQNITNAQQSATMTLRVTRRIEYVIS